jgi:hypothetical protein
MRTSRDINSLGPFVFAATGSMQRRRQPHRLERVHPCAQEAADELARLQLGHRPLWRAAPIRACRAPMPLTSGQSAEPVNALISSLVVAHVVLRHADVPGWQPIRQVLQVELVPIESLVIARLRSLQEAKSVEDAKAVLVEQFNEDLDGTATANLNITDEMRTDIKQLLLSLPSYQAPQAAASAADDQGTGVRVPGREHSLPRPSSNRPMRIFAARHSPPPW